MQTDRRRNVSLCPALLAMSCLSLLVGASAATAHTYSMYVLGNTPSARSDGCFARDISNVGRVVGFCNDHGFVFDGARPPRELPRLDTPTVARAERAEAINDDDEIAGASQASDGQSHMVRWTRAGFSSPTFVIADVSEDLPSAGTDIDQPGRVVGWLDRNGSSHSAMWHGGTIGLQDVSLDFSGIGAPAILTGIFADPTNTHVVSDEGSVTNLRNSRTSQMFKFCPNYFGSTVLTGRITGHPWLPATATQLLIPGTLQLPTRGDAVLARVDVAKLGIQGETDSSCTTASSPLPSLPIVIPSDVNSSGSVVGLLHPGGNAPVINLVGFVWDAGGTVNSLDSLLPPGSDPVIDAHGINEAGQIAATVLDQVGFVPRPAILSICGNGMVDLGEDCDDGAANGALPSCCSAFCRFQCADQDACTQDTCDATRTCRHTPIAGCNAGESTEALVGGSRGACQGGRFETSPEPTCVLSVPDADIRIPIGEGNRALPTATVVTVAAVPTADCAQSFGFGADGKRIASCIELLPDGQTFAPDSGVNIRYHWQAAVADPMGCDVAVPSGTPFPEGQLILFAEGTQATAACGLGATTGTAECPQDAALTNACVDAGFCGTATCRPGDDVLDVMDVRHFSLHALVFNPCEGKPNGFACSDGDECTQPDVCTDGVCIGNQIGADTDADGYCDAWETKVGCNPNDFYETPPQGLQSPGSPGPAPGQGLMYFAVPGDRRVQAATDPSCASLGVCGPTGFCTAGKISDPCDAAADCNAPQDTCRVVVNYANVASLTLPIAMLNRAPIGGFLPAKAGCARKVDVSLDPGRSANRLSLKAAGVISGRPRFDRDRLIYRK